MNFPSVTAPWQRCAYVDLSRGLSSAVYQFHAHESGNRDGKKKWPNDRLQIGEASRERIDWHDVPITGGRQRAEAEIQHDTDFFLIPVGAAMLAKASGINSQIRP